MTVILAAENMILSRSARPDCQRCIRKGLCSSDGDTEDRDMRERLRYWILLPDSWVTFWLSGVYETEMDFAVICFSHCCSVYRLKNECSSLPFFLARKAMSSGVNEHIGCRQLELLMRIGTEAACPCPRQVRSPKRGMVSFSWCAAAFVTLQKNSCS